MLIPILAALLALIAEPDKPPTPLAKDVTAQVSSERCKAAVETLAGFGTRHSLSETDSDTRGTGAARRWLRSELEASGKAGGDLLKVEFEEFDAPKMPRLPAGAHLVNVVATLPGTMPEAARRVVYVVGHYDTINGEKMDPKSDAPGANDDASGTSVVLECCRVLAGRKLDATVVFLCTAAEEQGLVGAKYHADTLATKKLYDHAFVLNNDIVGDPSIPFGVPFTTAGGAGSPLKDTTTVDSATFVRLFSEGIPKNASAEQLAKIRGEGAESDSPSRQLARYVAYVAEREGMAFRPKLVFRQDRFLRGGDHSAFNDAGFPGVRLSVPGEDYSRQHATVVQKDGKPYGDLPRFVSGEYIANVARLNVAAIVHLANAPSPPGNAVMLTKELTQNATLRWDIPPEPDVAGYEIMVRETTAPDWRVLSRIEAATARSITMPLSKDNYFFGIRAYDTGGYRSPVSFCWASKD